LLGLDDEVGWVGDVVGGAWGLRCAVCGDGEDEQPLRRVADGVDVVGLVPEERIDLAAGEQTGAGGDGCGGGRLLKSREGDIPEGQKDFRATHCSGCIRRSWAFRTF
jgi:hypothetical protein